MDRPRKVPEKGFNLRGLKRTVNQLIDYAIRGELRSSSTLRVTRTDSGSTAQVLVKGGTGAAAPTQLRHCVINSVFPDYLLVRFVEDRTGVEYFNVAKPYALRQTTEDVGSTVRGMEVSSYEPPAAEAQNRRLKATVSDKDGNDKDIFVDQAIYPAYGSEGATVVDPPAQNQLIVVAAMTSPTGVEVDEVPVKFIDINADKRGWENNFVAYTLCADEHAIISSGEVS